MSDDETDLEPQLLAPAREVEDSVIDACDCRYTQTNPDQGHSMKAQVLALPPTPGDDDRMELRPGMSVDTALLEDFARRHGIHCLSLFGSALRDDFTDRSDIDLLVEFEPDRISR